MSFAVAEVVPEALVRFWTCGKGEAEERGECVFAECPVVEKCTCAEEEVGGVHDGNLPVWILRYGREWRGKMYRYMLVR